MSCSFVRLSGNNTLLHVSSDCCCMLYSHSFGASSGYLVHRHWVNRILSEQMIHKIKALCITNTMLLLPGLLKSSNTALVYVSYIKFAFIVCWQIAAQKVSVFMVSVTSHYTHLPWCCSSHTLIGELAGNLYHFIFMISKYYYSCEVYCYTLYIQGNVCICAQSVSANLYAPTSDAYCIAHAILKTPEHMFTHQ